MLLTSAVSSQSREYHYERGSPDLYRLPPASTHSVMPDARYSFRRVLEEGRSLSPKLVATAESARDHADIIDQGFFAGRADTSDVVRHGRFDGRLSKRLNHFARQNSKRNKRPICLLFEYGYLGDPLVFLLVDMPRGRGFALAVAMTEERHAGRAGTYAVTVHLEGQEGVVRYATPGQASRGFGLLGSAVLEAAGIYERTRSPCM